MRHLERYGVDGFLLSLLGAMALAWLLPDAGRSGGWLHLDLFTSYGIGFIFFLLGVNLDLGMVRAEFGNWRLHLVTQGVSFLLFPLLMLALLGLVGPTLDHATRDGLFFLAVLPGGVSSVVASTKLARGNVLGALFNGTFSPLAGVIITPLWMEWYLSHNAEPLDLEAVFFRLGVLVMVPCVAGVAARPLLLPRFAPLMKVISNLDRITIVSMMANAYADSIVDGAWATVKPARIGAVFVLSLAMMSVVALCTLVLSRRAGLDRESTVAALFCGTKKALGSGVRMAEVLLAGAPVIGVVLLPIMIYHFQQLVLAALVARWLARGGGLETSAALPMLRRLGGRLWRGSMSGIFIALAGAAVADMLDWPAPLLTGSSVAVAAAALSGLPASTPAIVPPITAAMLGLLLGGQAMAFGDIGFTVDATLVALFAAVLVIPARRLIRVQPPTLIDQTEQRALRAVGQLAVVGVLSLLFSVAGWLPRAALVVSWGTAGDIALALPSVIGGGLLLRRLQVSDPWLIAGLMTGASSGWIFADGITASAPFVTVLGQVTVGHIVGARLVGLNWSAFIRILPRVGLNILPHLVAAIAFATALVAVGVGDPPLIVLLAMPAGALEGAVLALALAPGTCGAIAIAFSLRALVVDALRISSASVTYKVSSSLV